MTPFRLQPRSHRDDDGAAMTVLAAGARALLFADLLPQVDSPSGQWPYYSITPTVIPLFFC